MLHSLKNPQPLQKVLDVNRRNYLKNIRVLCAFCLLCGVHVYAREKITVTVCMVESQVDYFREKIITPFEKTNGVDVSVINIEELDKIGQTVNGNKKVGLYMVPFGTSWALVEEDVVQPISDHLSKQELRVFNEEYILTWLGRKNGQQYFLPHKYETRIMAYRLSAVREAVRLWNATDENGIALRDSVNDLMETVNGEGLPKGYTLEKDPGVWNFFDLFVAGVIWRARSKNREGRIGHRAKRYSGTALRIIDRVYQCGGDSAQLLTMNGDAVTDAFMWEAVYRSFGLFNERMFSERWSGYDLWREFNKKEINVSFLTQLDCFFVHGGQEKNEGDSPNDTSDIGFSIMPAGCSVQLDESGVVKRKGVRAVTNGGWWWAVPKGWNNVYRSFQLFRHITSRENQIEECTRFGMIPVRNDVLKNRTLLFYSGWISNIYRTSYKQIKINNDKVVPCDASFTEISELYLDAWTRIVDKKQWSGKHGKIPAWEEIDNLLNKNYQSRAYRIFDTRK